MFFKDFVSVKRKKIKKGASQTYDTPSLLFLFPTSIQRKHNEEYLHGCTSLSCRRDNLLSKKADRFIVESKQLDLIRTKIGKHDAIDPQTFLRWNEASDKEKIKQKLGKAEKAKNQPKMRLL